MKRKVISAIVALLPFAALAQTMNDAIQISQNDYYGSARTIGMGNAVTAVGGDLGSVGINPAGSAVAGYSQVALTSGLVVSSNVSAYAPSYAAYHTTAPSNALPTVQTFGASNKQDKVNFFAPDINVSLRMPTGRAAGLRAVTFGVTTSTSAFYLEDFSASGLNAGTSISGAFATGATLNADGAGKTMPGDILTQNYPYSSNYFWNYITSYHGGLINYNLDAETYYGSAETVEQSGGQYNYYVKGNLYQKYASSSSGRKQDILINLGLDFNDCLFFGINIGFPRINRKYDQYFYETAEDLQDFVVTPQYISSSGEYVCGPETTYDHSRYHYSYSMNGSGVYTKIGVIVLPTENLRLGASIQTPVFMRLRETWQIGVDCYWGNGGHDYADSNEGNYSYRFRAPWLLSGGVAYTFGSFGMLSVDYEMADFSSMKYSTLNDRTDDSFYRVNRLNKLFCGATHSVRAGVEIKPLPFLLLRGGLTLKTDPTCTYKDELGNTVDAYAYDANFDEFERGLYTLVGNRKPGNDITTSWSLGCGFSSSGAFFADVAVRRTKYPVVYTSPYSCYLDGQDVTVYSPEIRTVRRLWDVIFTIGWRF